MFNIIKKTTATVEVINTGETYGTAFDKKVLCPINAVINLYLKKLISFM